MQHIILLYMHAYAEKNIGGVIRTASSQGLERKLMATKNLVNSHPLRKMVVEIPLFTKVWGINPSFRWLAGWDFWLPSTVRPWKRFAMETLPDLEPAMSSAPSAEGVKA